MADIISDLEKTPLFSGLPMDVLKEAQRIATVRQYAADDFIFTQDSEGEAMYLLCEGMVSVDRTSMGGQEKVLSYLYAPSVIGELALLLGIPRSASVHCVKPVRAIMFYRETFQALAMRCPELTWRLAKLMAERMQSMNEELMVVAFSKSHVLVAHTLCALYRQRERAGVPNHRILELSHEELARRAGSTRESVSRVLKIFDLKKIVHNERRIIEILDIHELEQIMYELQEENIDN